MSSVSMPTPLPPSPAKRVGIFVDVQNMFYSAKSLHQSKVDYGRLLKEILAGRSLIRAIAYIVQKPEVNQSGFHEALARLGYDLRVKELKIRPDSSSASGVSSPGKGSWEVGMTVEAITLAPKLDVVVLVTGDGDYVQLATALKSLGCRVEVVSFERSTSADLIKAADQYIPIQDTWIFKEKKFEPDVDGMPVSPGSLPPSDGSHDEAESQPFVPSQPSALSSLHPDSGSRGKSVSSFGILA